MIKNLSVKDVLNCTNGELIMGDENAICKKFFIDTREIKEDDVFVAIKGKGADGNTFLNEAFENGAKVAIVTEVFLSNEEKEKYKDRTVIKVDNSIEALQKIATEKRKIYGKDFTVVAVTGSVGKTSTKDAIAGVLSQKYRVLKTKGNYNNDLGVPLTILSIQDEDVAVVEMGMNHLGEISRLSKIANPNIAVITNIGTSHIGNLGSRENILKAKLEILDGMDSPFLIINNDNDLLHNWYEIHKGDTKIKTFGIEKKSNAYGTGIILQENYSEFICNIDGESFKAKVPVGGKHFILNSLCAALVGRTLKLTNKQVKLGIKQLELTKKRMEVIALKGDIKLINDSYNASYESMKAAIEYLGNINGRKIAVLGDMFELGNYSEELHRNVGSEVAKNNIDILICSGDNSKFIIEEAIKNGMKKEDVYYKENLIEIEKLLKSLMQTKDNILIKASNGMKFYELAEKIVQLNSE